MVRRTDECEIERVNVSEKLLMSSDALRLQLELFLHSSQDYNLPQDYVICLELIHTSIHQSTLSTIQLFIRSSINPPTNLVFHLSITHSSIHPSIHPSIHSSILPSFHSSFRLLKLLELPADGSTNAIFFVFFILCFSVAIEGTY